MQVNLQIISKSVYNIVQRVKARGVALEHTSTACGKDNLLKVEHGDPATIRQSVH